MCEYAVESSYDVQQVLRGRGWNCDSAAEVVCILDNCGSVVERVDHIVDGAAVLAALVGQDVDEVLVGSHLRASLTCADAEELNDEQVEFKYELSDMLILPDTFVHFWWEFTDFLHI